MHTESSITRVQAFITAHRARIAVVLALVLALAITGGAALTLPLMGIISGNMVTAIGVLSTIGGAVAALAFYWSAE